MFSYQFTRVEPTVSDRRATILAKQHKSTFLIILASMPQHSDGTAATQTGHESGTTLWASTPAKWCNLLSVILTRSKMSFLAERSEAENPANRAIARLRNLKQTNDVAVRNYVTGGIAACCLRLQSCTTYNLLDSRYAAYAAAQE
jgi:hypothetical protein